MSGASPKVAYQPVTMDGSGKLEMDPGREQAYRRRLRKSVNIVAFIIVCLVVAVVISVVIILLSPRHEGVYEFHTVATNITATLEVGSYPDNATIGEDMKEAFTTLINRSMFREVFVEVIVLNVHRGSKTEVTILIVLTDIGDHLGSPSGSSEEPTDVLDLIQDTLRDDKIKGFHIENWFFLES